MAGFEAMTPPPEAVAYLINLALAVSLVCGAGLLAAHVCRRGAAPLQHGVLVWTLSLVLLSPGAVWQAQCNDLALVRITVPSRPDTRAAPTAEERPSAVVPSSPAGEARGTGRDRGPEAAAENTRPAFRPADLRPASGEPPQTATPAQSPGPAVVAAAASQSEGPSASMWWQVTGSIAAVLWAIGSLVGLIRLGWGYVALARFCRRLDPLTDPRQKLLVHRVADAVGLRKLPAVYFSRSAAVPVSIGLFRPAIVLPEAMPREAEEGQLQAILLHEMAHIARRDHWAGVGQRIAAVLFWWHPLVHRVCDDISDLREEICDNHVLLVQGEGRWLARILVELASRVTAGPRLPAAIGVTEPRLAGLTGRVTRLLNKERDMDTRMNLRSKLFVVACGLAALIGMATVGGLRLGYAQPAAELPLAMADPAGPQEPHAPAGEKRPASGAAKDAGDRLEFRGHVLDPDGKPVQGAKLYLIYFTSAELPPPPLRAVSGPDGSFRFSVAKSEFRGRGEAREPWLLSGVVAVADKLGLGWQSGLLLDTTDQIAELAKSMPGYSPEMMKKAIPDDRRKPVIRLVRDDVPITGRILDDKGQPVAGATLQLLEIQTGVRHDLNDWLNAVEKQKADYYQAQMYVPDGLTGHLRRQLPHLVPAATTDQDGRFRLLGAGRERIVRLQLSGPGIATERLYARTRPGATIQIQEQADYPSSRKVTYYGADFEYKARPSRPIVGVVRDQDSKAPLENVVVEGYKVAGDAMVGSSEFIHTKTDAQGRYRLTGMPVGQDNELLVVPPSDGPYLLSRKPADTRPDRNAIAVDVQLKRGIPIHGRVTDAATGKPVSAQIEYYVFSDNPHSKSAPGFRGVTYGRFGTLYMTDADGRYTIPGLPGRGIVTVLAHDHERYPRGAGAEKIKGADAELGLASYRTEPTDLMPVNVHARAEVNLPEDAKQGAADFVLQPFKRIEGLVLDDRGQPLSDVMFSGQGEYPSWYPASSGRFQVDGYEPGKPRTLLFVQRDRRLAGSLALKGPQQGPLRVRLESWGQVTGRLVDAQGKPLADVTLMDSSGKLPPQDVISGLPGPTAIKTDREGRFRIDGLAAGVSYEIEAIQKSSSPEFAHVGEGVIRHLASGVLVKPGETKDLGDLTIKPDKPPAAERKPAK